MTSLAKPAKILAPCSECTGSVMMSNCWCSQVGAFAPSSMTRSGIMVPLMIATPTECIQECAWVTPRIITRSVPIQEWNIVSERYTYSNSKIRLPLTPLWTLLMSHVQPFLESVWFDVLSLENRHSWCTFFYLRSNLNPWPFFFGEIDERDCNCNRTCICTYFTISTLYGLQKHLRRQRVQGSLSCTFVCLGLPNWLTYMVYQLGVLGWVRLLTS